MSDMAIRAEGISKKYCRSLKHTIFYGASDLAKSFFGINGHTDTLRDGEFWAVNDVSFELKRGESLGIIGSNGSGKSTILKMLNGIFMPDKGSIEINGRVGALIEVGAGFHPLLTGRENIYVNGAILGMTKKEIDKKFDEIVEFAGIGDFLDSPVKHYSSGMYVRLGFAIAVHCELDVLLVDEVLAVGDASFRQKCFWKFEEFKKAGRMLVLVTHDVEPIVRYCDKAIFLKKDAASLIGNPEEITGRYLQMSGGALRGEREKATRHVMRGAPLIDTDKTELEKFFSQPAAEDRCFIRKSYNKNAKRTGDKRGEIVDYLVVCGNEYDPATIYSGDTVDIYLKAVFYQHVEAPMFGFAIKADDGLYIYGSNTRFSMLSMAPAMENEVIIFKFTIRLNLRMGNLFFDMAIAEKLLEYDKPIDTRYNLIRLSIHHGERQFGGLVELESVCEEVLRVNHEHPAESN